AHLYVMPVDRVPYKELKRWTRRSSKILIKHSFLLFGILFMISPTLLDSPGTRKRGVFLKKTALRGHLRDRRFNIILQQGLGKVAESLAKRLLIAEGFIVKDFQCLS